MEKIAWITDSTCGLTEEEKKNHSIFVIPLQLTFGNETFFEHETLSTKLFYEKLETSKSSPTTSQPSLGSLVKLYEHIKEQGYEKAIAVYLSNELSGTISTSKMAAEMVGINVHVVDSMLTSFPMKQLLLKGIELQQEGKLFNEISQRLTSFVDGMGVYLAVGNLEQLHRGGRLSGSQAIVGNLLQIKPILTFYKGKLLIKEKVRTFKKAKTKMIELFKEVYSNHPFEEMSVAIVHTNSEEEASHLREVLKETYPDLDIFLQELGPTLGTHVGQGTIGICWFTKK
jgi:DegV family protein with EDD domain